MFYCENCQTKGMHIFDSLGAIVFEKGKMLLLQVTKEEDDYIPLDDLGIDVSRKGTCPFCGCIRSLSSFIRNHVIFKYDELNQINDKWKAHVKYEIIQGEDRLQFLVEMNENEMEFVQDVEFDSIYIFDKIEGDEFQDSMVNFKYRDELYTYVFMNDIKWKDNFNYFNNGEFGPRVPINMFNKLLDTFKFSNQISLLNQK